MAKKSDTINPKDLLLRYRGETDPILSKWYRPV